MNSSNIPQFQIVEANKEAKTFWFHHMLLVTNAQLLNIIDPRDVNKRLTWKDRVIGNFDYYWFLEEWIIMSWWWFNAKEVVDGSALTKAKIILWWEYLKWKWDVDARVESNFWKCNMLDYILKEFRRQFPYDSFEIDSELDLLEKYPSSRILRYWDNFLTSAIPICIEYILDNDKQIRFTQLYIQAINRMIKLRIEYRGDLLIHWVEYTEPRESSFWLTYIWSRKSLFQAYREAYWEAYPIEKIYIPYQLSWKE